MAAFEQPRAWGQGNISDSKAAPGKRSTSGTGAVSQTTNVLQWVGSIGLGVVVGAAAAFLVAGTLGVHETVVGSVHVSGSSSIQSAPTGNK